MRYKNLQRCFEAGITYTQTFDAENRLTVVVALSGTTTLTTTFVYDGDGRRVLQSRSDGTSVAYVNDLLEVETDPFYYLPRPTGSSVASGAIAANGSRGSVTAFVGGAARLAFTQGTVTLLGGGEGNGGGARLTRTTLRFYYYANGQPIAMRVVAHYGAATLYYLHHDHLGSTSLVTDASGGVAARQAYLPFGAVRPNQSQGTLPTQRGFTGQYADGTGLMYFQARYYDAHLNRWVQSDSIVPEPGNPQDLNRYSFVRNNPLKYTDPSGHCSQNRTDPNFAQCWALWQQIGAQYTNVSVDPRFLFDQLTKIQAALDNTLTAFNNDMQKFVNGLGNFSITHDNLLFADAPPGSNTINLSDRLLSEGDAVQYILHEIGHIFDAHGSKGNSDNYKSKVFENVFSPGCKSGWLGCTSDDASKRPYPDWLIDMTGGGGGWNPGGRTSDYGEGSSLDDYADSFSVVVSEAVGLVHAQSPLIDDARKQIIADQISQIPGHNQRRR